MNGQMCSNKFHIKAFVHGAAIQNDLPLSELNLPDN